MSEFDDMLDRVFPLSKQQYSGQCSDTIGGRHGLINVYGYCPWCKRKVASAVNNFVPSRYRIAEDIAAYRYMYDPDFGVENWERY